MKPTRHSTPEITAEDRRFMAEAVRLSRENIACGGGPFGAVIVRDGEIISTGVNRVTALCDPTAHAEVSAIRAACHREQCFKLDGCTIYTSCEPCPMCLSAIYWAGIQRIFYANTQGDAAAIEFDDSFIYNEIPLPPTQRSIAAWQIDDPNALEVFRLWAKMNDKIKY